MNNTAVTNVSHQDITINRTEYQACYQMLTVGGRDFHILPPSEITSKNINKMLIYKCLDVKEKEISNIATGKIENASVLFGIKLLIWPKIKSLLPSK